MCAVVVVVVVYSSMADCSKYTVEEAGFDISALKTSLIQYFRCRSRPSDHSSLPPHISELQRDEPHQPPPTHSSSPTRNTVISKRGEETRQEPEREDRRKGSTLSLVAGCCCSSHRWSAFLLTSDAPSLPPLLLLHPRNSTRNPATPALCPALPDTYYSKLWGELLFLILFIYISLLYCILIETSPAVLFVWAVATWGGSVAFTWRSGESETR